MGTITVKNGAGQDVTVNTLPANDGTTLPVSISGTLPVSGSFYLATQPVSAAALPLPTGAATATLQTAMNTLVANNTPADDVFIITPSDSADLATIPKALFVTGAGTLAIKGSSGATVSLGTVAVGSVLPIRARRVMSTNTTATVVGLV